MLIMLKYSYSILGGMQYMARSIITFFIRLCGTLVFSALLNCAQGLPEDISYHCGFWIFVGYGIVCIVANVFNYDNDDEKPLILGILSLLLGVGLSIIAIFTGHPICAGALFCATSISIAVDYYDYF